MCYLSESLPIVWGWRQRAVAWTVEMKCDKAAECVVPLHLLFKYVELGILFASYVHEFGQNDVLLAFS